MPTKKKPKSSKERLREYDRLMLRSSFVSLFWAAITERRRHARFTLQSLATAIGVGKSLVSRWFSNEQPNWELNTISDIAGALDLDIRVQAVHRATGMVFAPNGIITKTQLVPIENQPESTVDDLSPTEIATNSNPLFVVRLIAA
jgi:transcriptional regulator with XRE-family HTH domain